jgi:hypothetical protein
MIPRPGRAEQRFWRRWLGPLPASGSELMSVATGAQGKVGFLWGSREASGGSRSWAYSAPWCSLQGGLAAKAEPLVGTIERYA